MTQADNSLFQMVRSKFETWTQAVALLDVDRKTIQRWLANPGMIPLGKLHRIATVFGIDEGQLIAAALRAIDTPQNDVIERIERRAAG